MRVGFFTDRPPIFNGGFSQRIMREIELVTSIENIEVFLHSFVSINSSNRLNINKKIQEVYEPMGVKGYKLSFLVSSKLAKWDCVRGLYDKYYINQVVKFIEYFKIECLICENLWAAYLGGKACEQTGIKYVFDYHGVVPEESVFDGYCTVRDKKYNYQKRIEKFALEHAKSIVCVSNSFKKYLMDTFALKDKQIYVVPCCINEEDVEFDLNVRNKIRQELNICNRKIIIYAGSITKYQCIEEMIWLFSEILKKDKSFYFIFLCAYSNYPVAEKVFEKYRINKADYYIGSVSHEDVKKYYGASDFGIIIRENHLLNRVASPTKIAEYLSCGLPIIGTNCIGDINNINTEKIIFDFEDIKKRLPSCADRIVEFKISEKLREANYNRCKNVLKTQYMWSCYKEHYRQLLK